ncbi:MAG: hypothetical protein IGS54_26245 [Elainella sp. C42_A2020_010]|nr:hypothetical protein [Elainella sp. C42_A2020_010]
MAAHDRASGELAVVLQKLTSDANAPTSANYAQLQASLLNSWQAAAFTITNDTVAAALVHEGKSS